MTTRKIAEALCEASFEVCAKEIVPPWCDGCDLDEPAKNAFAQVQTLRRQRAELLEIWPHRKAELDGQFNDAVMVLALEVYEKLFDDEA